MASRLQLTIACDDFDHIRALMDGTVKPEGIDLTFITELTNPERHGAMVRKLAFDVCELNMPTYLMARDAGVPITAFPVFLFRRFRHGHVFINPQSGIKSPKDLIGKRIGSTTLSPASNVWINGILQEHHGVPFREQTWVLERDEDAPCKFPAWLKVERVPKGKTAVSMLLGGELPAMMTPQTPKPILDGDPRIARLFPNYPDDELAYYKQTGIFPIMHVTAIKNEIVKKYPWVPMMLCRAFEEAKQIAYKRMANVRVVPLPWFAAHWEQERKLFGPDPWVYGLGETNRKIVETAVRYTHEQGLTSRPLSIEEMFVPDCF